MSLTEALLLARRSRRKPPLRDSSLRALVAQIAWLDGRIAWRDGRVVFEYSSHATNGANETTRAISPTVSNLAQAQHCLLRIARSKRVGDNLGGKTAWIEERQQRLEWAKCLREIVAPDLVSLAKASRERNPQVARRLAQLLVAEALCLNELPLRPSEWLRRGGQNARQAVREVLHDATTPRPARALAAMLCGDWSRGATRNGESDEMWEDAWLQRAWAWGLAHGTASQPALITAMLRDDDIEYSMCCETVARGFQHLDFPGTALREMLDEGFSPREVAAIAQAAARWDDDAAQWKSRYRTLREQPIFIAHRRKHSAWRRAASAGRDHAISQLSDFLRALLSRSRDATHIDLAREVWLLTLQKVSSRIAEKGVHSHKDMAPLFETRNQTLLQLSRSCLDLPADLRGEYLRTLRKHLETKVPKHVTIEQIDAVWTGDFKSLHKLLMSCGDARLASEIFDKNLHRVLARQRIEPRKLRWLLGLLDSPAPSNWQVARLCRTLNQFSSIAEVRAAFDPVSQAARDLAPEHRLSLLMGFSQAAQSRDCDVRAAFSRLHAHLAALVAFVKHDDEDAYWDAERAAQSALELDDVLQTGAQNDENTARDAISNDENADDENAAISDDLLAFYSDSEREDSSETLAFEHRVLDLDTTAQNAATTALWLDWTLHCVQKMRERDASFTVWPMARWTRLAAVLAEGDFTRYQNVFRVAARSDSENSDDDLRKGLFASQNYPDLRASLSHVFAQNPQRCITFLVRLGLATRLGNEIRAPLQLLESPPSFDDASDNASSDNTDDIEYSMSWNDVLQLAPDTAADARLFRAMCRVSLQNDQIPRNVQEVFDEKRKWQRELLSIEDRLKNDSQRADLQARATSLRERLQNDAAWRKRARQSLTERLQKAAAEAHLRAAETQMTHCYRERLRVVAGAIPDDLELDDDLLNAILLSTDIESNRPLLRRLLRAHLGGDTKWRINHPANAQFLRQLKERNVDVETWLCEYSKKYRFALMESEDTKNERAKNKGNKISSVRLRLESQPIRILQMGNYFDTCLSFGGCNSFSTVANASELNKRVVYATNNRGHVVGRKLIALNENHKLVGFHTYTSLQNAGQNQKLRALFNRYIKSFAAQCNLELADDGEVPKLFAQDWYDDGVVAWQDDSPPSRKDTEEN